jgi:hypothetical protein
MPIGRSSASRARLSRSEAAERGLTAAGREDASARTCRPPCGGELPGARSGKPSRVIQPPTRAGTRNPDRTPLRASSQRAARRDALKPPAPAPHGVDHAPPLPQEQASRSRSDPRPLRTNRMCRSAVNGSRLAPAPVVDQRERGQSRVRRRLSGNPRRARWIASKGGLRNRPPHASWDVRLSRQRCAHSL